MAKEKRELTVSEREIAEQAWRAGWKARMTTRNANIAINQFMDGLQVEFDPDAVKPSIIPEQRGPADDEFPGGPRPQQGQG